ncbi:MAG: Hpt domain-containing protein [Nitrospirae bacterium]|nr:MAG: Hpt domain-containing protein [Nitrospirota bacterium]
MNGQEKITVYVDSDLEDIVPVFLQSRQKDILSMERALAEGDYETIRLIGHSMKGAGGGYGFDAITEIGASIERAAKQGDKDAIKRQIEALKDYLNRVEVKYV